MTSTATTTDTRPDPPDPGLEPETLIAALTARTAPVFAAMAWAEEEITAASRRRPGAAAALWHAFTVLAPRDIGPGMATEFVYRGHARELLERVAAGADLRPGTAAEIVLALAQTSLAAPMNGPGAGLYFRMWLHAFPDHPLTAEQAANQVAYEHLYGPQIDELEADLRRRLHDPHRQAGAVICDGHHHGQPVACPFAGR